MAELLADWRQVLARQDGLAGGGTSKVVEAKPAELRILANRAPAIAQRVVAQPMRAEDGEPDGNGRH